VDALQAIHHLHGNLAFGNIEYDAPTDLLIFQKVTSRPCKEVQHFFGMFVDSKGKGQFTAFSPGHPCQASGFLNMRLQIGKCILVLEKCHVTLETHVGWDIANGRVIEAPSDSLQLNINRDLQSFDERTLLKMEWLRGSREDHEAFFRPPKVVGGINSVSAGWLGADGTTYDFLFTQESAECIAQRKIGSEPIRSGIVPRGSIFSESSSTETQSSLSEKLREDAAISRVIDVSSMNQRENLAGEISVELELQRAVSCGLCRKDISKNFIRLPGCPHLYCQPCLMRWGEGGLSCPECGWAPQEAWLFAKGKLASITERSFFRPTLEKNWPFLDSF